MSAKARRLTLLVAIGLAGAMSGVAAAADRLSDRQVKELIEAVDQARDRFEDQLDGSLKNAILRGPRGEVNVRQYLEDYQTIVKNLHERFSDKYAASQEARVVLEQGTAMHKFLAGYDRQIKGRSEFDRLASELGRLAEAYAVTFPLEADAAPRRYNDAEVGKMATDLASQAELLKKAIDKDKTITSADKQTAKADLDEFKKIAGTVKSRVGDQKPATAEVRQLSDVGTRVGQFVGARQLPAAALTSWGGMRSGLETMNRAFGM